MVSSTAAAHPSLFYIAVTMRAARIKNVRPYGVQSHKAREEFSGCHEVTP
jgi:hypothetical protein